MFNVLHPSAKRHPSSNVLQALTAAGLPVETHGGVPGSCLAVELPAPVGDQGQGEPGRDAKSAGQMGNAGVGADDEVEALHDGAQLVRRLLVQDDVRTCLEPARQDQRHVVIRSQAL